MQPLQHDRFLPQVTQYVCVHVCVGYPASARPVLVIFKVLLLWRGRMTTGTLYFIIIIIILINLLFYTPYFIPLYPVHPQTVPHPVPPPHTPVSMWMSLPPTPPDL